MTAHLSRGDPPVADAPVIHSRSVLRQMDHFIMALKTDAAQDRPTFFLSLYWIEYAADAEPGHLAYLWATGIDGVEPIEAVITDSLAIPNAIGHRLRPGQWPMSDPTRPARLGRFQRTTSRDWAISFHIESEGVIVDARWETLSPPVYATGPTSSRDALITTMLTEAHLPSATVNGIRQPGGPFRNPIWRPWFGNERGSCVIGLGETIYESEEADS
jgi:hypothetical protein